MNLAQFEKSSLKGQIKEAVKLAESLRSDSQKPIDISFKEIVKTKFNMEMPSFYQELGIDPSHDTIQNIFTLPSDDVRWIIPEIFREALLVGYRAAPIWPSITAIEETSAGLSQIVPHLNMSDAAPEKVGEAETIPLGTISYGQKKVSIYKVGKGISIPYEVMQFCSLNLVSIFLRDFGVKLGHALDVLAINTIINGEQADGSESSPVIGITSTIDGKQYKDLLRPFIRMSRIGRTPTTIIANEDSALDTLDMKEFKWRVLGTPVLNPNLKTPVPQSVNYFIHGNVPVDQEIILDPSSTLLKLNAIPLTVESEKIVSNQTAAFYASLTTGFAKMFRDSAIILDSGHDLGVVGASYGFPTYMDIDPLQNVVLQ